MRDFTLNKFIELCNIIKKEGYTTYSVLDYLKNPPQFELPFVIVNPERTVVVSSSL